MKTRAWTHPVLWMTKTCQGHGIEVQIKIRFWTIKSKLISPEVLPTAQKNRLWAHIQLFLLSSPGQLYGHTSFLHHTLQYSFPKQKSWSTNILSSAFTMLITTSKPNCYCYSRYGTKPLAWRSMVCIKTNFNMLVLQRNRREWEPLITCNSCIHNASLLIYSKSCLSWT